MKELLQEMLFLDERTGKFSTSKFMMLVIFYLIVGLNIKALYLDREVKNSAALSELLIITSTLYFSRRMSFKTKNLEVGGDKSEKSTEE